MGEGVRVTEELKQSADKAKNDILYKAAMLRQRKYLEELVPKLSDDQVSLIMSSLIQAVNFVATCDMADGFRMNQNYRSPLGSSLQMVVELLRAPEEPTA